jgi:hypothetical protein
MACATAENSAAMIKINLSRLEVQPNDQIKANPDPQSGHPAPTA